MMKIGVVSDTHSRAIPDQLIKDFKKVRADFSRQLLLAAPPHLSDKDAQALIDEKLQRHLEGMIASIEKEAKEYEERFQK